MPGRAVFLDRDGVLNRVRVIEGKPFPPQNVAEVEILPGVPEALRMLRDAGFFLIVVSNQPDVARGVTSQSTVEAINDYLAERLPLDRVITCYDDGNESRRRKPRPDMLIEGAKEFDADLTKSFMVGDRWRDIEAGIAAGCKTVLIDYGYFEKRPPSYDFRASSLLEAAHFILSDESSHPRV